MPRSTVSTRELILITNDDAVVTRGMRAGQDSECETWESGESSHAPSPGVIAQWAEAAFWTFMKDWCGAERLPRDYEAAVHTMHLQAVFITAFATKFDGARMARLTANSEAACQ